jgi:endonuclease/exonuclease/phosphatase (EEP) superfamily protein YafD
MTFNIQWGREGWGHIAREVRAADADVLLMQDARAVPEGALKDALSSYEIRRFGQFIIASRLPVLEHEVGDVSFRGQRHTYLRAEIVTGGVVTTFFSVHLATPRDSILAVRSGDSSALAEIRASAEDRLTQARSLAQDLKRVRGPVILGGDLNATPSSLVCRALESAGLRNAFRAAGLGYGYTFGHLTRLRHSYLRIDHIYASREWEPIRCFTGGKQASDHRPVIADLFLN